MLGRRAVCHCPDPREPDLGALRKSPEFCDTEGAFDSAADAFQLYKGLNGGLIGDRDGTSR